MKMILAIIHTEDEIETTGELNRNSFFVTKLSTTGGFLKSKNTTLLIGTDDKEVNNALSIIKKNAGSRKTMTYSSSPGIAGGRYADAGLSIPIEAEIGGCTVFVWDVDQFQKY